MVQAAAMLLAGWAAGRPWVLETTDGVKTKGAFPERIVPHQPARGLRAVAHEFAPGR